MKKFKVLVVGDIMIDRYVYVETTRRAQEASIPVWDEIRTEYRLGGAANVAANLKSIGGDEVDVTLAGISSSDGIVGDLFDIANLKSLCSGYRDMIKTRYVDTNGKYLFRHDSMKNFPSESIERFGDLFSLLKHGSCHDAVIVSDYDKGTITPRVASFLGAYPIRFVDSKRKDLRIFKGFDVLKVNEQEYSTQVSNKDYECFESLFNFCVVTRGEKGAELRQYDSGMSKEKQYVVHSEEFKIDKVKSVDVTGCGDTHTAAMLFAYLKTQDIRLGVKFANQCAKIKVQQFGTTAVKGRSDETW